LYLSKYTSLSRPEIFRRGIAPVDSSFDYFDKDYRDCSAFVAAVEGVVGVGAYRDFR
jgi:hypothetical protein